MKIIESKHESFGEVKMEVIFGLKSVLAEQGFVLEENISDGTHAYLKDGRSIDGELKFNFLHELISVLSEGRPHIMERIGEYHHLVVTGLFNYLIEQCKYTELGTIYLLDCDFYSYYEDHRPNEVLGDEFQRTGVGFVFQELNHIDWYLTDNAGGMSRDEFIPILIGFLNAYLETSHDRLELLELSLISEKTITDTKQYIS